MNDVERLAEALRKANAELEVDPDELADAVKHAHRRLVGRLLAVAALSAIGALLLLSGGLAASKAIRDGRKSSSETKQAKASGDKSIDDSSGRSKSSGNSGRDNSSNATQGDGNAKKKQQQNRQGQSNLSSSKKAKQKEKPVVVGQPNLKVHSLTKVYIEIANDSSVESGPFEVAIKVEPASGEPYEESIQFDSIAPKGILVFDFTKELTCDGGQIVAEIDPKDAVKESKEEDNIGTDPCEPESGTEETPEKTTGEKEPTTSSAATSPAESDLSQAP